MRFLLDMPVSPTLLRVIESHGYEGVHAAEIGKSRAPDVELLKIAREEKRVLVTADLDFPRLLALSSAKRWYRRLRNTACGGFTAGGTGLLRASGRGLESAMFARTEDSLGLLDVRELSYLKFGVSLMFALPIKIVRATIPECWVLQGR